MERSSDFKLGASRTRAAIKKMIRDRVAELDKFDDPDGNFTPIKVELNMLGGRIEKEVRIGDHRSGGIGHAPKKKKAIRTT